MCRASSTPDTTRAHPRRCGEHSVLTGWSGPSGGSSPQVAGNITSYCTVSPDDAGSSPQVRGTSAATASWSPATWAHPRRCGEHNRGGIVWMRSTGSSPQVRGTCGAAVDREAEHGLIPAGAGNIALSLAMRAPTRAHPRRCGEHGIWGTSKFIEMGSSPQVRGTLRQGSAVQGVGGLIPAGAGNMGTPWPLRRGPRAHPRRCGEHPLPRAVCRN